MVREREAADDPSTGLTVGTARSGQAFTATMKRQETRERLLEDRKRLLKTLVDHDAGKLDHLGECDRDHFCRERQNENCRLQRTDRAPR